MKVAVINRSGNVGKTMISRQLLAPRLTGAQVVAIESINSDGTTEDALRGDQFLLLQKILGAADDDDDVVVDVGASNVELVTLAMRKFSGSHEDFDFYIVPTIPDSKQLRDTISTIEELKSIGVPAEKIRVVFNRIGDRDDFTEVYAPVLQYHAKSKAFTLRPKAVVHENELFSLLRARPDATVKGLIDDTTDYKALIAATKDTTRRVDLTGKLAERRLAIGVNAELDVVFKELFA